MRGNGGNKKGLNALSKIIKEIRIERKLESVIPAQMQLVSLTSYWMFSFYSLKFLASFWLIPSHPTILPTILPKAFGTQEAPGCAVSSS
jgi:hypothetical protein